MQHDSCTTGDAYGTASEIGYVHTSLEHSHGASKRRQMSEEYKSLYAGQTTYGTLCRARSPASSAVLLKFSACCMHRVRAACIMGTALRLFDTTMRLRWPRRLLGDALLLLLISTGACCVLLISITKFCKTVNAPLTSNVWLLHFCIC